MFFLFFCFLVRNNNAVWFMCRYWQSNEKFTHYQFQQRFLLLVFVLFRRAILQQCYRTLIHATQSSYLFVSCLFLLGIICKFGNFMTGTSLGRNWGGGSLGSRTSAWRMKQVRHMPARPYRRGSWGRRLMYRTWGGRSKSWDTFPSTPTSLPWRRLTRTKRLST